jgi:hypothetical protein
MEEKKLNCDEEEPDDGLGTDPVALWLEEPETGCFGLKGNTGLALKGLGSL